MYQPSQFAEKRPDAMHKLIREHSFGTLVTLGADGLNANHVPFDIDPQPSPFGTLRAHVARNNPVWHDIAAGVEVLVVFQGPQAYISPNWYPTKKESERVVPTYNYMVVHAYGRLRAIEDKKWIRSALERLTDHHERGMAQPWKVSDAPADFVEKLLDAIVGIEIPISRLIGKWKVSQNQPAINRAGVELGLRATGGEQELAMAQAVAVASQTSHLKDR